ncbi:MAG: PEP-CTERM sorting domain-containing protein [Ketobacter sp. GenoA1]|nr:MAG: PEP-CTERM sorting domain-containing protein [Ketobacter sp. GenoA1]RLT94118.1 MAG: PEP-CTERM sorting domain-containing protein [Ketobacter sp.]
MGFFMVLVKKSLVGSLALVAVGLANSANAIVIEQSFGVEDNFNGEFFVGNNYGLLSFAESASGDAQLTQGDGSVFSEDSMSQGGFSWSPIDLSGYSTINSIQIEYSAYGALPGAELRLNDYFIANPESQTSSVDAAPAQYVWTETVNVNSDLFAALMGEVLTLDFVMANVTDGWSLDYINFTIDVEELDVVGGDPQAVSEPLSIAIFGLGLAALGVSRKRRVS